MTLDLTGKHCPVIFSAVLFFVFEKFSWASNGGKCVLCWFYCLEKQKLSLERTPPGKKLHFCIHVRYFWKMKEKPANVNRGVCFSVKWKATCKNWAHLDKEKKFGLRSHFCGYCRQPFNYFHTKYHWLQLSMDTSVNKPELIRYQTWHVWSLNIWSLAVRYDLLHPQLSSRNDFGTQFGLTGMFYNLLNLFECKNIYVS